VKVILGAVFIIVGFILRFSSDEFKMTLVLPIKFFIIFFLYILMNFVFWMSKHKKLRGFVLENEISKRLTETEKEQKKNETLILSSLPKLVAERLRISDKNIFDSIEQGSVCFISIDGFNEACRINPSGALQTLNKILEIFDFHCQKYFCEKIKSFGSTYLAVCGAPEKVSNHYLKIAQFAIECRNAALEIIKESGYFTSVKIGLSCGPFVGGVLGVTKYLYDVFGDTVNTASRMMTTSEPNKIQLCETLYEKLKEEGEMLLERRGSIKVKGKGELVTYWLVNSKNSTNSIQK
jgi:adenylate cyclase